ncbi:hypothetical protein [Labedaea rhizosphaerae]|uniref:Muconolactone delta-isomerase n=1 Tax=Labedaea rhizosphaerae TaxID=598644 RepID=A0A4R6RZZ3_LABRH|nr:hypothetical protein [Labedaea rhizosphaerae]TDP92791.1 hypothetical protein EV186_1076 [Labedaea rhizosphaerae]
MHAQITYFRGPRSPQQVAAAEFAGHERVLPAVQALGRRFRGYRLLGADGTEIVISLADREEDLLDMQKAIFATTLLPGEDPALLTGPDSVELFPVVEVFDVEGGQSS